VTYFVNMSSSAWHTLLSCHLCDIISMCVWLVTHTDIEIMSHRSMTVICVLVYSLQLAHLILLAILRAVQNCSCFLKGFFLLFLCLYSKCLQYGKYFVWQKNFRIALSVLITISVHPAHVHIWTLLTHTLCLVTFHLCCVLSYF